MKLKKLSKSEWVTILLMTNLLSIFFGVYISDTSTGAITRELASTQNTPDQYAALTHDNILIVLNDIRLEHGLPQLEDNLSLTKIAQKELEGNCPVTSHDNFRNDLANGSFKQYEQVSQSLTSGGRGTRDAFKNLLDSPSHRDGIIGPSWGWTSVGIGYKTSPMNCVSLIFGK